LSGNRNATYGENWTYAGFGLSKGKWGKFELGYLLQTGVRNKTGDIRFLNLFQLTWITRYDFKKKPIK